MGEGCAEKMPVEVGFIISFDGNGRWRWTHFRLEGFWGDGIMILIAQSWSHDLNLLHNHHCLLSSLSSSLMLSAFFHFWRWLLIKLLSTVQLVPVL